MDVHDVEDRDGVRFNFNVWPASKVSLAKNVLRLGALYTPLKRIEGLPVLPYEPVVCRGCHSILNPFCTIDYNSKIWVCPFCFTRNPFPAHYMGISEQQLPAELVPQYTTVEYEVQRTNGMPPVFIYVIDTCIEQAELDALRQQLIVSLSWLPENAIVGIVTYGTVVHLHELGYTECSKSVVFRGNSIVTTDHVRELLGIAHRLPQKAGIPVAAAAALPSGVLPNARRFLVPADDGEFAINSVLEELSVDPWPVEADQRPLRCTGAALGVAVALAEAASAGAPVHVMAFVGGPCVAGPGQVAPVPFKEPIRGHHDIEHGRAPFVKPASTVYDELGQRLVAASASLDIFGASLDQVGFYEMRHAVNRTGGVMVMAENFSAPLFRQSFQRRFRKLPQTQFLDLAFGVTTEVLASRDLRVCGCLGPVESLRKTSVIVAPPDRSIGASGTCAWKMCSATSDTTLAVFLDVDVQPQGPVPQGQQRCLQFITYYQHSSGRFRMRATTVARPWVDGEAVRLIGTGFDQEAAAALLAREANDRAFTEPQMDTIRWIDRKLIQFCSRFGEYQPTDATSFQLQPHLSLFPQFMFHLRRCPQINVFNQSPDEAGYYRSLLNRECTANAMLMIQPTLLSYSFQKQREPVMLDVKSLNPEHILLLDIYTHVVIFHGATIADWRRAGYQAQAEYASFRQLLTMVEDDAQDLMQDRFPVPRFINCDQNTSQARFLTHRLNPSVTHSSTFHAASAYIVTDDVSLEVFLDHLAKLAVAQS